MSLPTESKPPLEGLNVVELSHLIAGPYCSMLLAGEGAQVIKVEPPKGELARCRDPLRRTGEGTMSAFFGALNRGKKSIVLDLKNPAGMETLRGLLKSADVFVTNLRSGALSRLGIHPRKLLEDYPRLVIASITGFGLENAGPLTDRAGLAMVAEALSGTTGLTRDHSGNPVWCGFALGDVAAGMTAHSAILLALRNQEKYGQGRVLDITLAECALPMVSVALARVQFADAKLAAKAGPNNYHGVPYGAFPASDGYVNIGVNSDAYWKRFCVAMGRPELGSDPRYATYLERADRQQEVNALAESFTRAHTRQQLTDKLSEADVPVASVLSMNEVLTSDYYRERGTLREVSDGVGSTLRLPVDPTGYENGNAPSSLPKLNEHRDEVLRTRLKLSPQAIADLQTRGAFGVR